VSHGSTSCECLVNLVYLYLHRPSLDQELESVDKPATPSAPTESALCDPGCAILPSHQASERPAAAVDDRPSVGPRCKKAVDGPPTHSCIPAPPLEGDISTANITMPQDDATMQAEIENSEGDVGAPARKRTEDAAPASLFGNPSCASNPLQFDSPTGSTRKSNARVELRVMAASCFCGKWDRPGLDHHAQA
jgi:hypothetical protein